MLPTIGGPEQDCRRADKEKMKQYFQNFDFDSFWEISDYATKSYVGAEINQKMINECEKSLGYRLPESYIRLLKSQNGGIPQNTNSPTEEATSWAENHVALTGIFGCDSTKRYSLCGELGGEFMKEEWGYPDIGIYICDCPSAGHDMIALDYRKNGKEGEPSVVHVDQEDDYRITFLAADFETFIRGLLNDEVFDTSSKDLERSLEIISKGSFSNLLQSLIDGNSEFDFETVIRKTCRELAEHKGYFALHADDLSYLLYDIQFFLYSSMHKIKNKEDYFDKYPSMIVFCDGEFSTGGYASDFIKDWMNERLSNKQITKRGLFKGLKFSREFTEQLLTHARIRTNKFNKPKKPRR